MFSSIIYTDINLYDSKGELLATSRPEIYEKGLIAPRMNTNSFREMVLNQRSEFTSIENIGGLNYISSYVPFVNTDNQLLAYINLPYFTRQDELTREITNLVVAIVNIFVLLSLLSFAVAVFISNKITQPLQLIQEKFARINLRGKNEKIDYEGRDEIGGLIDAYNEMVKQLSKSVEMIARSERESAWREMAKQIAHEIKNPLTPMRLSIQHLQRTWKDKSKDKDHQLERISKTIIEQIDNLSAIATEFSNFAKMPQPNNEKLNLADQLKSVINLFDNTENTKIELNLNSLSEVFVYADKEQLARVFINLIKNAIQASPEGEVSKVKVSLSVTSEKVNINVKDNGKGIPEEIRHKLFQPNFTTKSSGMGMGLAIVKSIVKNAGGDVHYSTEVNKGTVFTVELPLYKPAVSAE
jgi:nitrogen fixation/metabolism regulation signal transduction histidine kinase